MLGLPEPVSDPEAGRVLRRSSVAGAGRWLCRTRWITPGHLQQMGYLHGDNEPELGVDLIDFVAEITVPGTHALECEGSGGDGIGVVAGRAGVSQRPSPRFASQPAVLARMASGAAVSMAWR
jgi:hypothetical protein